MSLPSAHRRDLQRDVPTENVAVFFELLLQSSDETKADLTVHFVFSRVRSEKGFVCDPYKYRVQYW